MRTFGERLQREREMRGVTLEEIAEATKIGTRSLRALELEEFDKLPGGIFNKGFVRAYARFLGIDEEQAIADYAAANRESEAVLTVPQQSDSEQSEPEDAPSLALRALLRLGLVVVLVGAIAASGWYLYHHRRVQPGDLPPMNQASKQAQGVPVPPAVKPSGVPVNLVAAVPSAPSQPGSKAASKPLPLPSAPAPAKSAPSSAAVQPKPATGNSPGVVLRIRAHSDAWMQVTADGKLVLETILKASDERVVRADKLVVLDVGNAGGIEISFNGKPVAPLGPEGKPRKVAFTPEGMQQ